MKRIALPILALCLTLTEGVAQTITEPDWVDLISDNSGKEIKLSLKY